MFRFFDRTTNSIFGLQSSIIVLDERLTDETKQEVWNNNFYMIYSIGPGNTNIISANTGEEVVNLIIIDQTLTMGLLKFDPLEIAALILHEVGHIINKEPDEETELSEFYADDYVRNNGFGNQLLTGLRKYVGVIENNTNTEQGLYFFNSLEKQNQVLDSLNSRINRIENNEQLLINQN